MMSIATSKFDGLHSFRCYLNPSTGFIWALIAPVIAIILINCGFFIMAITIIRRHQKKKNDSKINTFKSVPIVLKPNS